MVGSRHDATVPRIGSPKRIEWLYVFNRCDGNDYVIHVETPAFICDISPRPELTNVRNVLDGWWWCVRHRSGSSWHNLRVDTRIVVDFFRWRIWPPKHFVLRRDVNVLTNFIWLDSRPKGRALEALIEGAQSAVVKAVYQQPEPIWGFTNGWDAYVPDDPSPDAASVVNLLRAIRWVVSVPVVHDNHCAVEVAFKWSSRALAIDLVAELREISCGKANPGHGR